MGVSIESKGKRQMGVELNLVPFIDFLSCLIAFLMMTAVLVDVSALGVEQGVGGGAGAELPPLTLHMSQGGVWVGRRVESGALIPRLESGPDWARVEAEIAADHAAHPDLTAVVVNTDDGQPYGDMATALDLVYRYDYDGAMLAGGPGN